MSHNFIRTESPKSEYHHTIHCTKCGYVSWYGNDNDINKKSRQDNIPKQCFSDPVITKEEHHG